MTVVARSEALYAHNIMLMFMVFMNMSVDMFENVICDRDSWSSVSLTQADVYESAACSG